MKLSMAVMAVPSRAAHVASMLSRLGPQVDEARRQGFDVAPPQVFVDEQRRGPWFGWRGAWGCRAPNATHHVVLQDDIQFCADLPMTLAKLAAARPNDVVSGFLPRRSVEKAAAQGLRWVATRRFLWAQCVLLPTSLGEEALRWIDAREGTEAAREWRHHDDVRLADFLTAQNRAVFVAVPHPVEHIGDAIGGSTMGHNQAPARRRARVWLGEEARGAHLEWNDLRHVRE